MSHWDLNYYVQYSFICSNKWLGPTCPRRLANKVTVHPFNGVLNPFNGDHVVIKNEKAFEVLIKINKNTVSERCKVLDDLHSRMLQFVK